MLHTKDCNVNNLFVLKQGLVMQMVVADQYDEIWHGIKHNKNVRSKFLADCLQQMDC